MKKQEKSLNNSFALFVTVLLFLSLQQENRGLNLTLCCFLSVRYVMDLHAIPAGLVFSIKRVIILNALNVKNKYKSNNQKKKILIINPTLIKIYLFAHRNSFLKYCLDKKYFINARKQSNRHIKNLNLFGKSISSK